MAQSAEEFWNAQYRSKSIPELPISIGRATAAAVQFFGPMQGKRVLDIGCGSGGTSLMLAQAGGEVTALDFSRNAVDGLNEFARTNGIDNLTAICGDALRIDELGKFDFVFGSLILHHIEPFAEFCMVLRQALRPGGRAFFFENNAASDLLVWFREHVVGRLWVPRHGDGIEFPLTPGEVALLRRQFRVDIRIPEMVFFQLVSTYLLRRRLLRLTKAMDDLMFRHDVGKRYSYRQYVMIHG